MAQDRVQDGEVRVGGPPKEAPGDITGDGVVNVGDATRLLRVVVGSQPLTPEEQKAADTNCDGSVGVGDVVQLLRSIVFHQPLQECP
jgi:hypothetical protein